MIQIPEPTGQKEFTDVADIGKGRIRRVIDNIKLENEGKLGLTDPDTPEDLGFKVFKLTPSHFRPWSGTADATADELSDQMDLFTDPLEDGWTISGVIYEVMLKEGFPLTSRFQKAKLGDNIAFLITDDDREQSFYICLDSHIPAGIAADLALQCRLKTI